MFIVIYFFKAALVTTLKYISQTHFPYCWLLTIWKSLSFYCLKTKDNKKSFTDQHQTPCHRLQASPLQWYSASVQTSVHCTSLNLINDSNLNLTWRFLFRVFKSTLSHIDRILSLSHFVSLRCPASIDIHSNTAFNTHSISTEEKYFLIFESIFETTTVVFHFDVPKSFLCNRFTLFYSGNS